MHPVEAATGKNYTKGESDWKLLCDHDSCWTDNISNFLFKNRHDLLTFAASAGYFYKIIDVPKGCNAKNFKARVY